MLNRFLTSKKVKIILFFATLLFAVLTVVTFMAPLNRKNEAIRWQGEKTIDQAKALAVTLDYYDAPRIESLIRLPAENPFYLNFCGLLSRIKQTMEYEKVYLLYYGIGGKIGYLADGDFRANGQPIADYQPLGAEYDIEQYTKRSRILLQELFDGKRETAYIPELLEDDRIASYLPIHSSNGTVIAVLGIDSKLEYSDFSKIGPTNFETLATINAILFIVSLLLFLACLDRSKNKNDKNEKGKFHYPNSKSTKKDSNIAVDSLEDIDPGDYI